MSDSAPPPDEARGRLVRSASVITLLTLASRLTGYARDRTIAALFGAKPIQELIQLQQAFKDKGYDISSLLDAGSGP